VSYSPSTGELDLALVRRLEEHAVGAWPATVTERTPDGWVLRATPGLDRGRSNHALTPCRELGLDEIPDAIARVEEFARRHGIHAGIQVSPLALHRTLQRELDRRSWATRWPVLVLAARVSDALAGAGPERVSDALAGAGPEPAGLRLEVADRATPDWMAAWARCEPGRDVASHADTVLPLLAGKAMFARLDDAAVVIGVDQGELLGMFSLAVDPARRRDGLGTAMVRALLVRATAQMAYLQVEEANAPALALYARLGFAEAYRYCHRVAPG
jgi:N-acetylglutamate synthase